MSVVVEPKSNIDYDELVREGSVDGSIYTSEAIFADEVERIFHRWWVYVGHESEIPEPGDYKQSWIGTQPLIMSRDEDRRLHILLNRCRHRGNTVCEEVCGNSLFFRCQYHGWTYANNGSLVGVPFPEGYDKSFRKEEHGLVEVPRVGVYRGFIFASLSSEGISLSEYLGEAKAMIDMFCDLSPIGEIELRAGTHKVYFEGNWKFVGMDGYHPAFVHRSMNDVLASTGADFAQVSGDASGNLTQDVGHGHVRLDYWPSRGRDLEFYVGPFRETEWGSQYLIDMEQAYGERRAHELIAFGSPHTGIWPNMQMIDVHVRHVRPLFAGRTEVHMSPALLKGVPDELNIKRLRQHEFGYGPLSFISPDDNEIFARNQIGLRATHSPEVLLTRGLHRTRRQDSGVLTGMYSDEVTQRGQLGEWKRVITM